ncbi:MSHA biogenesis protein MshI [Vibrio nigripulchritudo]|uniref:PilN domain-containing protein n=1 Tax=Vibrio nigripulchritudo TaxID=28173 RepID=UPI00190A33B4|nr:MSHA biogenesis protein MshI [Vibrio nigripulchritudo]BCL68504.1 MSHA biogenesis protein MshI [Vibrio nigripulchritudo]BDU29833.1 MSHA biogenesis protein MshI [Vibrio nigripulchritudo]
MNKMVSLLERLKGKSSSAKKVSVSLLEDAVYCSIDSQTELFPIKDRSWEQTLAKVLSDEKYTHSEVVITLGAHHYQTYQIERPEIPEEEWSVALPFLLKDLIAERVTDIVADGIPLPNSSKIQTYVLSKRVLTPLLAILEKSQITLDRILPEDEVWGQANEHAEDFLLLHQSAHSSFKINAYVTRDICFHRTIRGVSAPLTGAQASSLQIDGLALEMQRSIDYLSSQIKQAQFHKLFICCDDEIDEELTTALEERLSVKVGTLMDGDVRCGEVLTKYALRSDYRINLYPEHLKPKVELFTLPVVAASWLIVALVMFGYYGFIEYQIQQEKAQIAQLSSQSTTLKAQLTELQTMLGEHKPSPNKLAAVQRIEAEIRAKEASLNAVGQFDNQKQVGYSGIMSALSRLDRNDISLSQISINKNTLNVSGLARTPSAVPGWIKQFRNELDLVGRSFEQLNIGRNEDDIVTFELQAKRGGE